MTGQGNAPPALGYPRRRIAIPLAGPPVHQLPLGLILGWATGKIDESSPHEFLILLAL
jgi:hypothetical protein